MTSAKTTTREFTTRSPEETVSLGRKLAAELNPPQLVVLTGDLGAGKTTLIKGIAEGFAAAKQEDVTSPTFTLIHEYRGKQVNVFHIDLYRVDTQEQVFAAGLEEYFHQTDGLTVVEWAERYPLKEFRHARIESIGETQRRITYENPGA